MFKYSLLAVAAVLSVSSANAVPLITATPAIVNLNASSSNPNAGNSSPGYAYNPIILSLAAGSYSVGVVGKAGGGIYDAYAVYAQPVPNDPTSGYKGAYTDGNWSVLANGVTQTLPSTTRFYTAADALSFYSALAPLTFTLTSTQNVSFFVDDTSQPYFADNSGGVSLAVKSIAAVPEPASWALMIVGFGAVGGALRSSRRRAIPQIA